MSYGFDLGAWTRTVSTQSAVAQRWFDRGLNWTYAYNHEEAVVCFEQAADADPACAMAWWGIAYAAGPFYNRPWLRHSDAEIAEVLPKCHAAIERAGALTATAEPRERALIQALALRYQNAQTRDLATLNHWHAAYADAMRAVYRTFPDDPDIAALYIEAAVTCTPRQLWDLKTGHVKAGSRTDEVLPVLEHWMERIETDGPVHPGIAHMCIHALEMSPLPENALKAADMLVGLAPDAGHLEHMAAHVYVLCGDYAQAVAQSERAVRADDRYMDHAGDQNFYTTARCHDLHLFMYSAMFLGQYRKAMYAADRICDMARPELISASAPFMASILDGYAAMRVHVLVRFGRWDALIATPAPGAPDLRPIGVAMHAYGQGVAHAALGNIEEAARSAEHLLTAKSNIPDDAIFLSNTVHDMLGVAEAMLEGELQYRKRNYECAFDWLRQAVARDDSLNFTEPWAWMHPPRHALGALLAEQGRYSEAETVFRADLGLTDDLARPCQHPGNIWALHGLASCLSASGDHASTAFVAKSLCIAAARADVPISSACFCSGG